MAIIGFNPTPRPLTHHLINSADTMSVHQHIDNGGHTLTVDQWGNMVVETGFFGYSHTAVMLSGIDIDGMIAFLQQAKVFIADHQEQE